MHCLHSNSAQNSYIIMSWVKGTVPLFWPRGPKTAYIFQGNELIAKLLNSKMGPSYQRKGEYFRLLLKMTRLLFNVISYFRKWPGYYLKWPGYFLIWLVTIKWDFRLLYTSKKWPLLPGPPATSQLTGSH